MGGPRTRAFENQDILITGEILGKRKEGLVAVNEKGCLFNVAIHVEIKCDRRSKHQEYCATGGRPYIPSITLTVQQP